MAQVENAISPPNGRYPQINLNTGLSFAMLLVVVPLVVWLVFIRSDVNNQAEKLISHEGQIKELRASFETFRFGQAAADTKLEGRLVGIEVLLRQLIDRLERDRRGERPNPFPP